MPGWTCPFCDQNATITSSNVSIREHGFGDDSKHGSHVVKTRVVVCPNEDCKEYTLVATLAGYVEIAGSWHQKIERNWQLIPASAAKVFPDYVPQALLSDYDEACLIRDLSPKASATLARRCLQGIIRDFWKVSKPRLIDEIEAIKDRVDPLTWAAIDAVRQIGNIGAHMEKDINVIIDVDPQEAGLLIGLMETLISDWYVSRHLREERLRAIIELSDEKKQLKAQASTTK